MLTLINSREDLDNAPDDVRAAFIERLGAGIYSWEWQDGAWELVANTQTIESFGLTLDDFPDAPKPDKPESNPDEDAKQQAIDEARNNRAQAYRNEADPVFFKAQRGEASLEEWQAIVESIRERFPYPEG